MKSGSHERNHTIRVEKQTLRRTYYCASFTYTTMHGRIILGKDCVINNKITSGK